MTDKPIDEKDVFNSARQIAAPEERLDYLQKACGHDPAGMHRVLELLRVYDQERSFLESSPVARGATIDQPIAERPGTVIGPYKLLQQIGEGGMGVVWMAEQTKPVQRKVALKVIKPGMDSRQVIARFEAERQALAMMDHVNIARVFDGGATEAGRPYFVMELVHGVPITKYCDDNHLTPRERLELFVPVCQAIQHAHQKGIIHRDVKPTNVMITLYDGKPVPKVIDFGVAKATEQKLTERTLFTQYGTMIGTLEYMSPEQAEMSALGVDTRSDIYSLGVLLYELLTGSTPLTHKRMKEAAYAEILRMIKEEEPPKPSTRLSDSGEALASISALRKTEPAKLTKLVRGELDWIVMKTLEKDRNRRYETANGFAADVQRYLCGETVQAVPPSVGYRFRKFARRNKAALAFTGLVLLILLTLTGGIGWNVRDRAARQAAVEQEASLALKEAERWQEQGKWSAALSVAKRAEGLLAAGGSDEVRDRVRQLRKDLEMVLRLEEIPLLHTEIRDNKWDYEGVDRAYAEAFAAYGLDVLGLPVEHAAAQIRARPGVAVALIAALDSWAGFPSRRDDGTRERLREVAQAADSDPWLRQVREAAKQKNGKQLAALAASPDLLRRRPSCWRGLAASLRTNGQREAGLEVLFRGQRQYPGDFGLNFNLAVELQLAKPPRLDEAVAYYRAALALWPQSPAVHNNLGNALRKQNKLDDAIATYEKAIELDPKYAPAHVNLGNALLKQNKLDVAIACYTKAIELDPKYAPAHNDLGIALKRKGQLDDAIAAYNEAIKLNPTYALPYHNLGIALKAQQKTDQAIAAYEKAVKLDPENAGANYYLGMALSEQGKLPEAIAAYHKVIDIDQQYAPVHIDLGNALSVQGKTDDAIAAYRKAIELDPKAARAHYLLGLAQSQKGLVADAIASYREATRLKPDYISAYRNWAWLVAAGPDRKCWDGKRAVELATRLGTLAPMDNRNWCLLGAAHYRAGNWKESLAALQKSMDVRKGGQSTDWLFLAMVNWQLGNQDEARKWYDRAVERMEKNQVKSEGVRRYRAEAADLLRIETKKD